MRHRLTRTFLLGAGILLLALSVPADTLEMKDGRLIEGKYLGGTRYNIRFQVNGDIQVYAISDVATLTFSGRSAPPSRTLQAPNREVPPGASPERRPEFGTRPSPQRTADHATVPAGTRLVVRMIDGVDSDTAQVGDRFHASLVEDLLAADGTVVALRGTDVYGRLVEAKEAGRVQGRSQLRLELTDILINNQLQRIVTGDYEVSGSSCGADTAKKVGGGAAIGAIVGAIAGGGKGAAIGAGVGGAAGGAVQIMTKGEKVKVPSETILDFTLTQPLTVRFPAAGVR